MPVCDREERVNEMLLQQNSVGFFFPDKNVINSDEKKYKIQVSRGYVHGWLFFFFFLIFSLSIFFTLIVSIYVEVKKLFLLKPFCQPLAPYP